MTDYDRDNLYFLLNADEETLKDWYNTVDEDDIEYASELMTEYSKELRVRAIFADCEDTSTVVDAVSALKKYMLNNK